MNPNPEPKATPPSPRPLAIGVMLLTSIVFRLIPYGVRPPNVAPIGASGLFSGGRFPLWLAFLLQLVAMVISDLLLWKFFAWQPFNLYVYASFGVYLLLGRALLRGKDSPLR